MTKSTTFRKAEYSIFLGEDCLVSLQEFIAVSGSKIFVLVDENTKRHCLPLFLEKTGISSNSITLIESKSGEENKTLDSCKYIWRELADGGADRKSLLINLGGGVITDMGGFAAASFKRGIKFINVPTTLMAQLDAAIGGKTGINLDKLKNQIGLFNHPYSIYIDAEFLRSLPNEHILSGFAEALKYGLIYDKKLWEEISKVNIEEVTDWYDWIVPSVKIKMEVVEKDPNEKDLRKILNYGHTIGHALETFSLKKGKPISHGEAVANGLVVESLISSKVLGLDEQIPKDVFEIIRSNFSKAAISESDIPELISIMLHDKKNIEGRINFTLIKDIGEAVVDQFCDHVIIKESILDYLSFLSLAKMQRR